MIQSLSLKKKFCIEHTIPFFMSSRNLSRFLSVSISVDKRRRWEEWLAMTALRMTRRTIGLHINVIQCEHIISNDDGWEWIELYNGHYSVDWEHGTNRSNITNDRNGGNTTNIGKRSNVLCSNIGFFVLLFLLK